MFQKYSGSRICCPNRVPIVPTSTCCPAYVVPDWETRNRVPLPESLRLRAQVESCGLYIRSGPPSSLCVPGGEEGDTTTASTTASTSTPTVSLNAAPVEVRTRSAGEYTQLLGIQALNANSNAFNPERRFQQYFPESIPAPERVVCPERIPNPVIVRDRGCIPQSLFAPSVLPPNN